MIDDVSVKSRIDWAEGILHKSIDRLYVIKTGNGDILDAILGFQPELAECLLETMLFYREIKAEERKTIKSKHDMDSDCFRKRMAQIHGYLEAVKGVIEIGKSLGDAFAWFFYRDNYSELEKHLQHKSTGLFVSGIGGRGEIEFIKHQQNLNGLFVIYHGITNILRVGDFSLYAFGAGVVGVGEIKTTEKIEMDCEKLCVHIYISSKIRFDHAEMCPPFEKEIIVSPEKAPNPQHLSAQLSVQDELLKREIAGFSASHAGDFEYDLINKLDNNPVVMNEDRTLLLVSAKEPFDNLFEILMSAVKPSLPNESIRDAAMKMVLPNNEYNQFILGPIDTSMTVSRIPVFWWHIDKQICSDIYFNRVRIEAVFNPAKLIQYYCARGFSIKQSTKASGRREFTLFLHNGSKCLELHHFDRYFDLIAHSLLKTTSVTSMIDSVISDIQSQQYGSTTKVDMHIRLSNFGRKTDEA